MYRSRVALMAVSALALTACHAHRLTESGITRTEARAVPAFHAVKVGGAVALSVRVVPGQAQKVSVSGDSNFLPHVHTQVQGGVLQVDTDDGLHDIHADIQVPALTALTLSGAVRAAVHQVAGDTFALELSGASQVTLDGGVRALSVNLSGAGTVRAFTLRAEDVTAQLSGVGHVEVFASKSLNATISGAGKVIYDGHPAKVTQALTGVGSIAAK